MNDDIYNKFWDVIGKPRPKGMEETYQALLSANVFATSEAFKAGDFARADAIREAFDAIGGRAAHAEYSANQLDAIMVRLPSLDRAIDPLAKRGFATRISQGWNGLVSRTKALMPQKPLSLGEPEALPLVELASGAPLEPILDSNRLVLTTEEMAKFKPPTVSALVGNLSLAEKQAAASASLAAQRTEALAAQAKVAARQAEIVASARETALAASQLPNGTIRQRLSANTANFAERATMPLINRFSTKDPYKILGITPHTSQTAAMAAFEAKLSALGEKRITSPRAQLEWQRLHDAYEMVYEQLFERTKFTPPAIPVPERTSKIGAALGRAREATTGMFGKMKGWVRGKPATALPEASAEAPEVIKLLAGPTAEAAASAVETPNLPILHPTANKARSSSTAGEAPTGKAKMASGGIAEAEFSEIKLITGPVYSSAELTGGRRYSYIGNTIEHSPLRGKLLLAAGVVAAAAVGYFGNRKQEKYPMPPMPRPRAASWAEATQQPAISSELLR